MTVTHAMKVTTADTIPGVDIQEHLLVVHGDALMSTDGFTGQAGILHDLFSNTTVPTEFGNARWKAHESLKKAAAWHKADAVIGAVYSYIPIGSAHLLISVSGTAVRFRSGSAAVHTAKTDSGDAQATSSGTGEPGDQPA